MAKDIYTRGLKKDNEDINLQSKIMDIHFLLGDYKKCIKLCNKILSRDKEHIDATERLAHSYFKLKWYQKLINLAKDIYASKKLPQSLKLLAEMWIADA